MNESDLFQKLQNDFTIIDLHPFGETDMLAYGLYNHYPFTIFFYWENNEAHPYVLRHGFYGSLHEHLCKTHRIHPDLLKHRTCPICHELQFDREAYDCFALHENPTEAESDYFNSYQSWEFIIEEDPQFLYVFPKDIENNHDRNEFTLNNAEAEQFSYPAKEESFNLLQSSFFRLFALKIKAFQSK